MDFARNVFSFGEFLIPTFPGSPRGTSETAESMDLGCIGDVFRIDDLSEFSNEDIAGPIPSRSGALSSTVYSQTVAKRDSCSSFDFNADIKEEEEFARIDGIKCVSSTYEDEIGLEWLSDFGGDSFVAMESSNSGGSFGGSSIADSEKQNVTDSAEEGLITESAVINERKSWLELVVPGRARSKRSRVGAVPAWSYEETMARKRTKGIQDSGAQPRRCTHCLTQRTPQWRAGPSGPKSLCNACGVRFKSGRLFPEYRPAKSPTFVSYMHSNSHKKVLEMRKQTGDISQQEQLSFGNQQQRPQSLKVSIKIAGPFP